MLSDFGLVAFNGLAWAMAVFIVAAGLTLVFGILHVLNFSHGGFLMIGAYVSALFYQGIFMPTYSMFVIGCGVALFLLLDVWIRRSRTGKLVQSVAADPWMCGLLGVNAPAMYTAVVVISFALAGFGGGLLAANQSLSPELGGHYIIQAFGVIIVGGIGNIRGAFLASVLLGLVVSFGTVYVPEYPGIFFYLAIVAILMFRPEGLIKQKGLA